jgi:hypothetical protein
MLQTHFGKPKTVQTSSSGLLDRRIDDRRSDPQLLDATNAILIHAPSITDPRS